MAKKYLITLTLGAIFMLAAGIPAMATINSISSDWCQSCLPGAVHRIVAGGQTSMVVKGQFVDLSTRVEISGSGVSVSFGDRTGGSNSSVVVKFNVGPSADLGERTVKLRYAVETSGPDTFKVKVVRGGNVDRIERKFTPAGGAPRLIAPDAIPVNQRVTLVFSGSKLGDAALASILVVRNPQIVSSTETRCEVELEFTQTGAHDVNLYDADVGPQPGNLLYKFFYGGTKKVTVVGASSSPTTGTFNPPILSSGGSVTTTFVDIAPRANLLNLFRRTGNSVTVSGQTFLQVEDRWCTDNQVQTPAPGNPPNAKLITVDDIQWGVSNVGTAEITAAFDSQLLSNGQVLQTQPIGGGTLHPGATLNFTFHRTTTRSTVRVFRFAPPNQPGCFANPNAVEFFEDPPFTVKVDVGTAVPETAINRINNARSY